MAFHRAINTHQLHWHTARLLVDLPFVVDDIDVDCVVLDRWPVNVRTLNTVILMMGLMVLPMYVEWLISWLSVDLQTRDSVVQCNFDCCCCCNGHLSTVSSHVRWSTALGCRSMRPHPMFQCCLSIVVAEQPVPVPAADDRSWVSKRLPRRDTKNKFKKNN